MGNELSVVDSFCVVDKTSISFKRDVTKDEWQKVFDACRHIEGCVQFWIGDLLKYREQQWGMYKDVAGESGYKQKTLEQYKYIADSVKPSVRTEGLSHQHHQQVAPLEQEQQKEWLNKASENKWSVRELKDEIRKDSRKSLKIPELPEGVFDVIYADPPWEYEHCASNSRQIENQYPTMLIEEIQNLDVPSADNSVLFLWATAPKVEEALSVMNSWGFTYRTCSIWDKQVIGMGYWFRNQHELLLVGCKGSFSPPEQSDRVSSVYSEKRGQHSKKPDHYYDLIESMFPNAKYLELFSRRKYNEKWSVYGNEI